MPANWYLSSQGRQLGPFPSSKVLAAHKAGKVAAADLVWRDGMAQWQPLSEVLAELESEASTAARPVAAAPNPAAVAPTADAPSVAAVAAPAYAPSTVAYFNPSGDLTERVRKALKGMPPATGPRGEFPLNDQQLDTLKHAAGLRRKINLFDGLCRVLGAIGMIVGVVTLIGALGMSGRMPMEGVLTGFALLGISVLNYFCGVAARKCQLWGPITFIALNGLALIFQVGAVAMSPAPFEAIMLPAILSLVIAALLLIAGINALISIRPFLNAPVWVQEAIVGSGF